MEVLGFSNMTCLVFQLEIVEAWNICSRVIQKALLGIEYNMYELNNS